MPRTTAASRESGGCLSSSASSAQGSPTGLARLDTPQLYRDACTGTLRARFRGVRGRGFRDLRWRGKRTSRALWRSHDERAQPQRHLRQQDLHLRAG